MIYIALVNWNGGDGSKAVDIDAALGKDPYREASGVSIYSAFAENGAALPVLARFAVFQTSSWHVFSFKEVRRG